MPPPSRPSPPPRTPNPPAPPPWPTARLPLPLERPTPPSPRPLAQAATNTGGLELDSSIGIIIIPLSMSLAIWMIVTVAVMLAYKYRRHWMCRARRVAPADARQPAPRAAGTATLLQEVALDKSDPRTALLPEGAELSVSLLHKPERVFLGLTLCPPPEDSHHPRVESASPFRNATPFLPGDAIISINGISAISVELVSRDVSHPLRPIFTTA